MNRQEAAQLLPLIEAFIAGKTIQYLLPAEKSQALGVWKDMNDVLFTDIPQNYRIKPEPREWFANLHHDKSGTIHTTKENSDFAERMQRPDEKVRVREIID